MKPCSLLVVVPLAVLGLFLLAGCATDDTPEPPIAKYNSQGWSRPESWEGSAGFGPLPQTR